DDRRNPDTGEVHPWARGLVDRARSYTEITPSKTGLRIIGTGDGAAIHRNLNVEDGVSVEVYRKATRYITITGDALAESPSTIANIDALINEVLVELDAAQGEGDEATGDKLESLIHGGCGDQFNGDKSRAVMWVIIE